MVIYPVDKVIQPLNNWGQMELSMFQLVEQEFYRPKYVEKYCGNYLYPILFFYFYFYVVLAVDCRFFVQY